MALFEFGMSGLLTREDTYNDKLNVGMLADGSTSMLADISSQEVIITCSGKKRRVSSYLSEPLKFSAKANWQEMFGGGVMSIAGTGLGLLTDLAQYGKGWTVQQPWMNRKLYKSTTPLSFTLKLPFIATSVDTAKEEVWDPLEALLSFVYPRKLSKEDGTDVSATEALGDSKLVQVSMKKQSAVNNEENHVNAEDVGVLPAFLGLFKAYAIPGPGLRFGMSAGDQSTHGDNVAISIGQFLSFSACYLESVEVELSEVMTPNGYPTSGTATVQATCMEANYCKNDGTFYFNGFSDNQSDLTIALDACYGAADKISQSFMELKDSLIGFWGGGKK